MSHAVAAAGPIAAAPLSPRTRLLLEGPVARTLLTYGQSSDPDSPYSADQTRLFSQERWVTSRFCERDILASPRLKVVWPRERR